MLLYVLHLLGCARPCDFESYPSIATTEDLLQACNIEEDFHLQEPCLQEWDNSDSIEQRFKLYDRCELSIFGSPEEFAFSTGDHYQAALMYRWFLSKELPTSTEYAKLFLKPSSFAAIAFPPIQSTKYPKLTSTEVQLFNENIHSEGGYGRFPDWHIPMTVTHPLVPALDINMRTLRHVVASAASESNPIELVFLGKDLVRVSFFAPSQSEKTIVDENTPIPAEQRVRINPDDQMTISELIPLLQKLDGKEIELAIQHRPCFEPAEGMLCLAMNDSVVYMDKEPATDAIIKECTSQKVCKSNPYTWTWAEQVCQFQGKRLPTVDEFQAAKIEGQYWSWNRDMNALPPQQNCADGIPYCNGNNRFLLSDGSGKLINQTVKSMPYCASDNHILSDKEPYFFTDPFPDPPPLMKNEGLATLANSVKHDDLEDKGICGMDIRQFWNENLQNGGRSDKDCRDPYSYITSNEPWRYVWGHHLKNLGGGYVGVGSDQGYDFISSARSEWAWIYDYDPNIYRLHKLLRAVILQAQRPEEFVGYFASEKREELESVVKATYSEAEAKEYISLYHAYSRRMHRTYTQELEAYPIPDFGWLAVPENYAYIRSMYQQDRIVIVKGDLMGPNAFRSISSIAQEMEVPIRIFYVSNAPLAWGGSITPGYRDNVLALEPAFDENSVFIAAHGGGSRKLHERGRWMYITANARLLSQRIGQHYYSDHLMWDSEKSVEEDLRTVAIPNRRRKIESVDFPVVSN